MPGFPNNVSIKELFPTLERPTKANSGTLPEYRREGSTKIELELTLVNDGQMNDTR